MPHHELPIPALAPRRGEDRYGRSNSPARDLSRRMGFTAVATRCGAAVAVLMRILEVGTCVRRVTPRGSECPPHLTAVAPQMPVSNRAAVSTRNDCDSFVRAGSTACGERAD